ncbi:COR domain-containing protein [Roseburia sp. 1XD42-69]|uniref:COR domain-containing protein n=2 Tax=Lachnospiraceae TaxID=186803 RepID=UPI000EA393F4|nr:COR domain-containing protein [Roseburia sp. 1XD42-69]RKJ60712.1 hypothetical protein D7Y06_22860 [Roseburia sp. 1XD42-69]
MSTEMRPLGLYKYNAEEMDINEAIKKLEEARQTHEPIVGYAKEYDEERKQLLIDYHGVAGYMRNGYITINPHLKPCEIVGKTVLMRVTKIYVENMEFICERTSVEAEAREAIEELPVGAFVDGMVTQLWNNASAFVDLMEGHCGYLPLSRVTRLPTTCCTIDEFIHEGELLHFCIFNRRNVEKGARVVLSFLEFDKPWEQEWDKLNLHIGSLCHGFLRSDRMKSNQYYLALDDRQIYITVQADAAVSEQYPETVRITYVDMEKQAVVGELYSPVESPQENMPEESTQEDQPTQEEHALEKESVYEVSLAKSLFRRSVKTTVSPFSIWQNEEKVCDSDLTKSVSYRQLEQYYQKGVLGVEHNEIIKAVNKLLFCTTKQILSYFYSHGLCPEIKSQDKLSNKIESLDKRSLIVRMHFAGDTGNGIYKVCCMNENGRYLLKNMLGIRRLPNKPSMLIDVTHIKKILAANQYALACMERVPSCKDLQNQVVLLADTDIPLRPTSIVQFGDSILLLEAVRRNKNWEEEIEEKYRRYNLFFQNYRTNKLDKKNFKILGSREVYLLLVCEDELHAREVHKVLACQDKGAHVYFTYDLLVFQKEFEFSMFRFFDDGETLAYYSVLDLLESNKQCYTVSDIDYIHFHDCTFNVFPEQYLRRMLELGQATEFSFKNLTVCDVHQDVEYLYKKDYDAFFESVQLSRNRELSEAVWEPRVFLLGSGGAGKTSLMRVIGNLPCNDDEPKTNGVKIEVNLWKELPWMQSGKTRIDHISVWDFAGQEHDISLNCLLMMTVALYILVLDARREDDPEEWLNYIQTYSPKSKVLLVINKIDTVNPVVSIENRMHYSQINIAKYCDKYANIVGVYQVSCRDLQIPGNELEELKRDIYSQILAMESQFHKIWPTEAKELRPWLRNVGGFITIKEFKDKCGELGLANKCDFTLTLCKNAGLCIYHKKIHPYIVLDPQWLTYGISKLLKNHEFSENKWWMEKEAAIAVIEQEEPHAPFSYRNGADAFLQILEKMKICFPEGDSYFFPSFLPYNTQRRTANSTEPLDSWYERQISYTCLPPNIFPELQGRLWRNHADDPDWKLSKGEILFYHNRKQMLARKEKNEIVLAIRKGSPLTDNLSNDEKQAMKEVRSILREIHIENGLESPDGTGIADTDKKIVDSIVLKGRSQDMRMQKLRYAYREEYMRKLCMAGQENNYFPEVDRWYNVASLLLDPYDEEKMREIYKEYLVHVFKYPNNGGDFDAEDMPTKEERGMGFFIPYQGEWFVVLCAHEVREATEELRFETLVGNEFNANFIAIGDDGLDIALYRVEKESYRWGRTVPNEILSFRQNDRKNLIAGYCIGRTDGGVLREFDSCGTAAADENQKKEYNYLHVADESKKVFVGMSGTCMMNMINRCVMGMVCEVNVNHNNIGLMPIENIWKFIEQTICQDTRKDG